MKITVLGSGGWGTALALLLLDNGNDVTLWSFDPKEAEILCERRENPLLAGVPLPEELKVIAVTDDGEVMGVQHWTYPVYGVQFHPESILTPDGKRMLENFIRLER